MSIIAELLPNYYLNFISLYVPQAHAYSDPADFHISGMDSIPFFSLALLGPVGGGSRAVQLLREPLKFKKGESELSGTACHPAPNAQKPRPLQCTLKNSCLGS